MAFPTRHWIKFSGTLAAGAKTALTHTLIENGKTSVTPNAVLFDMDSGTYTQAPNASIGCYAASTGTQVFLSNFDGSATHYYSVIVRHYHTVDGANV